MGVASYKSKRAGNVKHSSLHEMGMRVLLLFFLLATSICAAQFAGPNAPYPVINQCKDCSGRSVSRDQECSLEADSATEQYQSCRCDADCTTYGDCCPSTHDTCLDSSDEIGEKSELFQCRGIFLGERVEGRNPPGGYHYWMVSSCPNRRLEEVGDSEEVQEIVRSCIDHLDSDRYPPITDLHSGLVYRNKHCARCNNVSNSAALSWDWGFVCDPELMDLLNNSNNYTLTEERFNQFCKINEFVEPSSQLPPSLPPARLCYPQIDSCLELDTLNEILPAPWNSTYYHSIVELCRESHFQNHVDLRVNRTIPFRNEYCALCNGVDIGDMGCFEPDLLGGAGIGIGPAPFTIILDVFGRGKVATGSHTIASSIDVSCSDTTEVFDPVIGRCHPIVSTPDDDGMNNTNANCSEKLIALTDPTAFEYVSTDMLLYSDELYTVKFNTSNGTPVICANFSTNGTIVTTINFFSFNYPAAYKILTYIGCPLSVIGCILILLTYSLFKELRTLPSQILMHLAIAILVGILLILAGGPIGMKFKVMCTPIAILSHYIYLCHFSWMSLMSTEIARNIYQAFKMKAHESKAYKAKLLIAYMLLGWGVPLLIVLLTVIVNFTTTGLVLYGDGISGYCWINHSPSLIVAFLTPMGILLAYNSVIVVIVTIYLCVSSRSHSKLNGGTKVPFVRFNIAIFSVSGVTWLFGFIALLPRLEWAWIPYIIFNSTQGFVIFVAFLFTKRVVLLYWGLFTRACHWQKRTTELESSTKVTMSSVKVESKYSSEEHLAV